MTKPNRTYLVEVSDEITISRKAYILVEAPNAEAAEEAAIERANNAAHQIEWDEEQKDALPYEANCDPENPEDARFIELLYASRRPAGLDDDEAGDFARLQSMLGVSDIEIRAFNETHPIGETVMPEPETPQYEDGEVIGINSDGHVLQWDAKGDTTGIPGPYSSGETPEEFGINDMTSIERSRIGR